MNRTVPCVLMRAGTSRGPFFLREWLPPDDVARDETLIGAIGASDLLQLDGVGGSSTLTSKVAIVSRSSEPGCDVDYLGLGDVADSVIPKPVLVSAGDDADSVTSRYFTPRRCHTSHAVTGAIGVATAFALPGTVASGLPGASGVRHRGAAPARPHRRGRDLGRRGCRHPNRRAALVRTARKILEGELHLPAAQPAAIAAWPDKPITIAVPTAAGGGNDVLARTIAAKLRALLGQALVVDVRSGADGSIASEYVARAPADGHTLMLGYIGTHAINPALQPLRYDPVNDFQPIGLVGYSPTLMVANLQVPVKDVADLVAQLRPEPGRYCCASAGTGTAPHFAVELFKRHAASVMPSVPYKGAAPALGDTIGGRTQFMFPSLFSAYPHIKAGQLRAGRGRPAAGGEPARRADARGGGHRRGGRDPVVRPVRPSGDAARGGRAPERGAEPGAGRRRGDAADGGTRRRCAGQHAGALGALVRRELARWQRVVQEARLAPG